MITRQFVVSIDFESTDQLVKQKYQTLLASYISDAVQSWGGKFDPASDPFFQEIVAKPDNVRVQVVK